MSVEPQRPAQSPEVRRIGMVLFEYGGGRQRAERRADFKGRRTRTAEKTCRWHSGIHRVWHRRPRRWVVQRTPRTPPPVDQPLVPHNQGLEGREIFTVQRCLFSCRFLDQRRYQFPFPDRNAPAAEVTQRTSLSRFSYTPCADSE